MKAKNMTTLHLRNSISRSPLRRGFLLIAVALACLGLLPTARAQAAGPDGGYPGGNTAEGQSALLSRTSGVWNTALGYQTLYHLTSGNQNTATGYQTLFNNTTGSLSVANGSQALYHNTTGSFNTATGFRALYTNATGSDNTANGYEALTFNITGQDNMANGFKALYKNTTGLQNTASGSQALYNNTHGGDNVAVGFQALFSNVSGLENTAIGDQALLDNIGNFNVAVGGAALLNNATGNENTAVGSGALNDTKGNDNTALGFQAGILATTVDGNVYIGAGMSGIAGESDHTYIRNINNTSVSGGGTDTVTINLTTGLLGHATSSRRYKEKIKPMDNASQALFALKPVTFRYKKDIDQSQSLDYGLIAEDVAQVDPNLAIHDRNGQIESVRYSAINAMLLNEFLKEHKKVENLEKDLRAIIVQQQKQIETLAAGLQKVSAQLELSKSAPQMAGNDR
jgi:hypothetical protein